MRSFKRIIRLRRAAALRHIRQHDIQPGTDVQEVLERRLADGEAFGYLKGGCSPAQAQLLHPFGDDYGTLGGGSEWAGAGDAGAVRAPQLARQLWREREAEARAWYNIPPHSVFRRLWDTAALVLIYAMMVAVPLEIAFYVQAGCVGAGVPSEELDTDAYLGASDDTKGIFVFSTITAVFFMIDVVLNLLTGVFEEVDGELKVDYNMWRIAKQYARTYMLTDVLAIIPWNCIMMECNEQMNYYNLGELFKLLRIYGMGRRSPGSPFQWIDHVSEVRKEFSFQARRLVTFALLMLEAVHCFACLNWLILRVQHFPQGSWPQILGVVQGSTMERWLWSFFNFVSCLIGLSYGSYPPATWPEALLWIFAMLSLTVMFAMFNGFILNFIISSSMASQAYKDRMDRLRVTLKQRRVPKPLQGRIMDFMAAKYGPARQVSYDDEVMRELPPSIRSQVALLSCGPLLARVPMLAQHPVLMEDVAPLLQRTVALPGQVLLQQDHVLHSVTFIHSGFVDIRLQVAGTAHSALLDTLGPGDFFAELALLPVPSARSMPDGKEVSRELREGIVVGNRWRAPFTAVALSSCELYQLHADDFQRVLREQPELAEELEEEGRKFVLRLLTALEEEREEEAARGGAGSPRRGAGGFPSGDSIGVDIIGVDIALGSPLASPMAQAAAAQAAAPPLGAINRSMTQPQLGRRRLSARVASMRY